MKPKKEKNHSKLFWIIIILIMQLFLIAIIIFSLSESIKKEFQETGKLLNFNPITPLLKILGIALYHDIFEDKYVFYVSVNGNDSYEGNASQPFKTLEKARDSIRTLQPLDKDVIVYLREGIYNIQQPFELSSQDSGTNEHIITYTAYPREKAVISGGEKINLNWQAYDNKIYSANVSDLRFNSLFVDGKRAIRAKEPDEGFYFIKSVDADTNKSAFRFKNNDLNSSWRNLNDIEVIAYRRWEASRFKIDKIEEDKVYFKENLSEDRSYYWDYDFAWHTPYNTSRYYVENFLEGLDEPGEWYLDKTSSTLYYYPFSEKQIQNSEFIIPIINKLVFFNGGSGENYIKYINFNNIVFSYTDWNYPSYGMEYLSGSLNNLSNAVDFNNALQCKLENNTFIHIGGSAIGNYNWQYNGNLSIKNNEIYDIGGAAIDFRATILTGPIKNIEISNNRIHDIARIHKNKLAILGSKLSNSSISHNLIYNSTASGIVISSLDINPSTWIPSIIEYNEVHNTEQEMNDGSGIYVNVDQPGVIIQYNKVHDIVMTTKHSCDFGLSGIYLDEGALGVTVKKNWVYNNHNGIDLHKSENANIENNIIVDSNNSFFTAANLFNENNLTKNIIYSNKYQPSILYIGYYPQSVIQNLSSDYNLFYKTGNNTNWNLNTSRLRTANDSNSIYLNPLFINYENNNFELQTSSPAFNLGFENFNLNNAGPVSIECFDDNDCVNNEACIQRECICYYTSAEICDSIDNNCDGDVDENSCSSPPKPPEGGGGGGGGGGSGRPLQNNTNQTNQENNTSNNIPAESQNLTNQNETPEIPVNPLKKPNNYMILYILVIILIAGIILTLIFLIKEIIQKQRITSLKENLLNKYQQQTI